MADATRQPESTVAETVTSAETGVNNWLGAAGAGILAGVVMAVPMAVMMPGALETAIPALYGMDGALAGVSAHLAHSAVFGVVFAALVRFGGRWTDTDDRIRMAGIGVAYGVVLWLIAASVVMPAWLGAVGIDATVPTFDITSMVAHALFGVVLGAAFPSLKRY